MALTKDQILSLDDIEIKEIEVPQWGETVFIRQLTRGQQDAYHRRLYGNKSLNLKQQGRKQELDGALDIFGHDSWLFVQGVCDEGGNRLFTNADANKLDDRNGEAIGFVAAEIIKFSGMDADVDQLDELKN